jgi:hypothetical protein
MTHTSGIIKLAFELGSLGLQDLHIKGPCCIAAFFIHLCDTLALILSTLQGGLFLFIRSGALCLLLAPRFCFAFECLEVQ